MKRVFSSNSQVCHVFASQTQSEGRSGNIFFENNKIYSYGHHYLAAEIYQVDSYQVCLINSHKYSSSTSWHLNEIEDAVSHMIHMRVKCPGDPKRSLSLKHAELAEEYFDFFNQRSIRWDYTNKWRDDLWAGFHKEVTRFNMLCSIFNLSSLRIDLTSDHKQLWFEKIEQLKASYALKNTPEAIAKREAERLKRQQREELKKIAELNTAIEKFRAGGERSNSLRSLRYQLLRIKDEQVETSNGAVVKLEDAVAFIRKVNGSKVKAGTKVGPYSFASLNGGVIRVGCHTIELTEALSVLSAYVTPLKVIKGGLR